MMSKRLRSLARLLFAALAVGACHTLPVAEAPSEFAALKPQTRQEALRAVSSSGVVYRVRVERDGPKASLAFWAEALTRKLKEDGYTVLSSGPLAVAGRDGMAVETVAPVGETDYGYMVAVTARGDELLIAEAAGERKAVDHLKPAIRDALAHIAWP